MRTIKQLTDKGDIISVVRILRSSNNPKTQLDALKAISVLAKKGIVDPIAIDKINALLFNGNKDIRVQAAFAIGDMAEKGVFKEESLQPLIDLSSKNDTSVRWSTTFALKALAKDGIFDGDAINFFSERLRDRFDKVAYNAAFAIGHLAEQDIVDKSTVFPLTALLSDKNIVCRKAAAFALRNLAMKDIYDCTSDSIELKSLKKILDDFDRSTRIYASEAIEELKKKGVSDSTEVHNYHYGDNIGTQITDSVMTSGCTDYETYTNDYYGYSIDYPDTWDTGWGASFTNPETDSTVSVSVEDLSTFYGGYSLEEYVNFIQSMSGFDINDGEYTTFKGYDAYEIEYTYSNEFTGVTSYHTKVICFIDGSNMYNLVYNTKDKYYEDDLKTVNKMMDSFTFDID